MKNSVLIKPLVAALLTLTIIGCSSTEEEPVAPAEAEPVAEPAVEPQQEAAKPMVGMANPAAVFCTDTGGELVPRTNDDGSEDAYCKLSDGGYIDQWEYYRAQHHRPKADMANPAAVFCEQKGGMLKTETVDQVATTYCNLPDGSAVEQWQYFRDNHPQN
ncbi:hypothetical protein SIN8267_01827 [Sinobacterium norvegicum]|uniref:DUF333 domain-containing protein n=1 Tax=Sinobacterium norvegicum TaxID=1641715 RepID=A0ABN8EGY8_9GAMM|nr:DUF333 domain-containing protein [Sinobacterium norvegicum]CAH0991713.1 hypothetical protein SIN8267_01827 [Sinobacterium norvegicum]